MIVVYRKVSGPLHKGPESVLGVSPILKMRSRKSRRVAQFSGTWYLPRMEIQCTFQCAYCFEENETVVDGSGALRQQYVEDCQVCCKPNLLTISIDAERHAAHIAAEPE